MNKKIIVFIFINSIFIINNITAQKSTNLSDLWAFDMLEIPKNKIQKEKLHKITVAVIDDAFSLSHKSIKPFLHKLENEIPGNFLDDDGNGYVDDAYGWDIADNDNDVSIKVGKEAIFYHGTWVASIITQIVKLHYGKEAENLVEIMPIKVLEDKAINSAIRKGYLGIKYAIDNGADIISLSWSGGNVTLQEKNIIAEAYAKGIIIVAAAGNFNERKVLYPANFNKVIAVSGIGANLKKYKEANYGDNIVVTAPAVYVKGAHPSKDNAYFHENGTSASSAIVAGVIAILKTKNPLLTSEECETILTNSAILNSKDINFKGLLGAGSVNVKRALIALEKPLEYQDFTKSKATLIWTNQNNNQLLKVNSLVSLEGYFIKPNVNHVKKKSKKSFHIFLKDTLWKKYSFEKIPEKIFIPNKTFSIKTLGKLKKKDLFTISYAAKTIDSTTLYCRDITYLNDKKGTVSDGSKTNNYSNKSSCKWQITAPKGKKIKFNFIKMNTQGNVDYVYLADGKSLIPKNIFAKFSGNSKPPVVISNTNDVLVWFLSDKKKTQKGWEFEYEFID